MSKTHFDAIETNSLTVAGQPVGGSNVIAATVTFDPPSLATMTGAVSSAITVTGAVLGRRVEVYPPYDLQGVQVQAYVSAANAIKFSLFNPTGATIDLASGSWKVKVVAP
ncbi:hypothetical protein [Paenibacillus sp. Aloe-11]|uniref:hypothetical protein n=1 Tax=unclassified Paenibacillus TaxID=185978 RepID=UPI00024EFFAF|nr:hypothetical protein [Paenibacillus sp. Aloe-11]EHS59458.1 hypothetical protein WG8_0673 [Paenibacillus sp. Aloe-11]